MAYNCLEKFPIRSKSSLIECENTKNDIQASMTIKLNFFIIASSAVFSVVFFEGRAFSASSNELTALADFYGSDKGRIHRCAHHYTPYYEAIFSKAMPKSLLEIGLNIDSSDDIPSLKMWKKYLGEDAEIYGFDIRPEFLRFQNTDEKINIIIGDQSKEMDLRKCLSKKYDIIIDDGFHASKHQQVSLKILWGSLRNGGCYVIEDLHYQPPGDFGIKTRDLLLKWQAGIFETSEFISQIELNKILESLERIELFNSNSPHWPKEISKNAFAVLYKKKQ
jgi:hypothetical protein